MKATGEIQAIIEGLRSPHEGAGLDPTRIIPITLNITCAEDVTGTMISRECLMFSSIMPERIDRQDCFHQTVLILTIWR